MSDYAELEIALRAKSAAGYPLEIRYLPLGSDTEELIPKDDQAYAKIDLDELNRHALDAPEYGKLLARSVFAHPKIAEAFRSARESLNGRSQAALRVRLYLRGADELHRVHWEALCDSPDGEPLFTGTSVLFSRYLTSERWYPPAGVKELKALIVIADPPAGAFDPEQYDPDKDENPVLGQVAVAEERARAEAGFRKSKIAFTTLATKQPDSAGPATFANILDHLREDIDILYLVCHGGLRPDGVACLFLEDGQKDAAELVKKIATIQLRLAVLVSCQSAGGAGTGASSTLSALGPMLVEAGGVPAVVAMQGKIKMDTVAEFMPAFFKELKRSGGQIDQAMGAARDAARDADCADYWMPVLFMRLKSGQLWYVPRLVPSGGRPEKQVWDRLNEAINNDQCTPILGPGMLQDLIGTSREIAAAMAGDRFPFAPVFRGELPVVAQYLAVYLGRALSVKEDLARLLSQRLSMPGGPDPKKPENFGAILSAAAAAQRAVNASEPHRILASKPFKIYLTANPDNLMEDALVEAGRHPRSDFSRWNTDPYLNLRQYPTIREREPNYEPTADEPLVYHLFGQLALPDPLSNAEPSFGCAARHEAALGSIALTEDDYFQYLMSIRSKGAAKDDVPGGVTRRLVEDSLLFLGFGLEDWNFRVLLRSIFSFEGSAARQNYGHPCVAAQIQPSDDRAEQPSQVAGYFKDYFSASKIDIFWGNTGEFVQAFAANTSAFMWNKPA
ncbi:MAG TPA: CHAT domain-containing protein [Bryobacteraceae bacterium]|nr:CHAT domain-containing protein [Bryobacteraceae bacterium]